MWRRARFGLILCAFGIHAWSTRRASRRDDDWTMDDGPWHLCNRCGAIR